MLNVWVRAAENFANSEILANQENPAGEVK